MSKGASPHQSAFGRVASLRVIPLFGCGACICLEELDLSRDHVRV
jgi:hypothetical protein